MKQMKTSTIRLGFTAALAIFLFALALLVTGSPLLAVPLSERLGLPLGNVITWFGMTALVMLVWFGSRGLREPASRRDRIYRQLWFILLALAVLWPFASYALAGNWSFSFGSREEFRGSSRAADWFFRYSYAVVLLPMLLVLARIAHVGLARWRGKG
mgnify:FL=1|jgi:hypothetical protein